MDPARGLITLMSPSRLHEELATIFGDIVDVAAEILSGAGRGIGSTRLRRSGDPPDTGMEPDCAFYVGDRARAYSAALREGEATADKFLDQVPPDLVVEVEITNADEGKAERYADVGVREMWRLRGRKGSREFETEFLALNPGEPPRPLDASAVLEGLEPADVREAMDEARLGATKSERIEAVARVVHRRRQRNRARPRRGGVPTRCRTEPVSRRTYWSSPAEAQGLRGTRRVVPIADALKFTLTANSVEREVGAGTRIREHAIPRETEGLQRAVGDLEADATHR